MSTHYGRMVVLDDRILMFANAEDAAEYIGFDLQPSRGGAACTRRTARSTSSSTATCTSGTRAPRTGSRAEQYAKGWIECFHAYQGLGPAETHWSLEHFQKYSVDDFEKDVFVNGRRRQRRVPVDVPEGVVHEGLQRHRAATRRCWTSSPGKLIVNGRWDPREGEAGLEQLGPTTRSTASRASSSTRPSGTTARAAGSSTTPRRCRSWSCARSSASRTSTSTRARRSGRWTRTPSTSPTSTTRRRTSPELNFIVEHVGLPRIEDFCFMATQEPNVYAGLAVVIGGLMHARPRFFAKVMGELLFWVGEDKMLFGSDYAHLGAEVADRGLRRLGLPRRRRTPTTPAGRPRRKKKILGPQRGQALRHRGAGGLACPARAPRPRRRRAARGGRA